MNNLEIVTLGAGCFWCVEAIFSALNGVEKVEPGYMGGKVKKPTYREVCYGATGHAEVIRLHFDPTTIVLKEILEVFWATHDPTTLNRQGADQGTQYRSVIFYCNEDQKRIAEQSKAETDASDLWANPIVTEITAAEEFYLAEDYHQDYYKNNSGQSYCQVVINPKLAKFRKRFADKLK